MMNQSDDKENDGQGPDNISSMNEDEKWTPRKFLEEMRHEAIAVSLVEEPNESMTLDILIAQCHALVMTNQEIWERCKPFHCTTIPSTDNTQPDKLMFYRVGYWNVKSRRSRETRFVIESTGDATKSCFEIPIRLPARLECLVPPFPKDKEEAMPNYEVLLKRSMLLIDEVLTGFLLEFRAFLEKRQVALGKVDTWLLQPKEYADFLQVNFGVTISFPDSLVPRDTASLSSWKCSLRYAKCSKCVKELQDHRQNEKEGWLYCDGSGTRGSFAVRGSTKELLEYSCTATVEFNFCIERSEDQSLLVKLLEVLRNNVVLPT